MKHIVCIVLYLAVITLLSAWLLAAVARVAR